LVLVVGLSLIAGPAVAAELSWSPGWDKLTEPLNRSTSFVHWSLSPENPFLTVIYQLNGATPNKLYEVGIHVEDCTKSVSPFGQFPSFGTCGPITRQGHTVNVQAFAFGVVLTDALGNGTFDVLVGPIKPGSYRFQFDVRDGPCLPLIGGGTDCSVDFQAPAPFATTVKLKVP
jgi:hypothetical protein